MKLLEEREPKEQIEILTALVSDLLGELWVENEDDDESIVNFRINRIYQQCYKYDAEVKCKAGNHEPALTGGSARKPEYTCIHCGVKNR